MIETRHLIRAAEIARQMSEGTRLYRAEIREQGLLLTGADKAAYPQIMAYRQFVPWKDLESPVASFIVERTFEKMGRALDEERAKNVEPAPEAKTP